MRKKEKKIKAKKIFLIFALIASAFVIQKSLSKYVLKEEDTHIQESTAFYFESEIADVDDEKDYILKDWDGITTKTINFSVKNYINKLQKTNEDIKYKISAKIIGDSDAINDENLVELIVNNTLGEAISGNQICTLSKSDLNEDNYTLNIKPESNLEDGKEIKIQLVISAQNPYTKDLITNITLVVNTKPYEAQLINSDNEEYVTLNLKINYPQDFSIKYDNAKLILDKSSYLVNGIEIINNINTFNILKTDLESGQSYEINFIKKETGEIVLGIDIITN